MLLNLTKIKIVFLREPICGLEYAENAFAAGAVPWAPVGELTALPRPPSRLGGDTTLQSQTPHHSAPSALGSAPLHIISGYATGREGTEKDSRGGEVRLPHSKFMDPLNITTLRISRTLQRLI